MNIGFIVNSWESINPNEDSSIRLIHEAVLREHNVGIIYPNSLSIRQSRTHGLVRKIKPDIKISANIPSFYKRVSFKEQLLPLSGFDAIFIRSNPPIDPIMLNFLDSVKDDTFIINDINGLRKANNKLYPALLEDMGTDIVPVTHVSKSMKFLKSVIQESKQDKMILKPLDGYGGSGVIVLEKRAMQNVNSLLDFYISGKNQGNYVILQEFVEGAEKGDTRVLMLNGQPIGAYKRVPASDDIRSNIKAGATGQKHILTKAERAICKRIGPKLVKDGLYFAGLDIISNKLIEINVVSPGGIMRINQFNRVKLQKHVIDFVESIVNTKEIAIDRKRELKRMIDEA